jgi:hypothetical protein
MMFQYSPPALQPLVSPSRIARLANEAITDSTRLTALVENVVEQCVETNRATPLLRFLEATLTVILSGMTS